jgi:hypothetical protein
MDTIAATRIMLVIIFFWLPKLNQDRGEQWLDDVSTSPELKLSILVLTVCLKTFFLSDLSFWRSFYIDYRVFRFDALIGIGRTCSLTFARHNSCRLPCLSRWNRIGSQNLDGFSLLAIPSMRVPPGRVRRMILALAGILPLMLPPRKRVFRLFPWSNR